MKKPNFRHIYPFICTGCGKRRMSMVYSRRIGEKCQICLKNNGVPGQIELIPSAQTTSILGKSAANLQDETTREALEGMPFATAIVKGKNGKTYKDKLVIKNGKLKISKRVAFEILHKSQIKKNIGSLALDAGTGRSKTVYPKFKQYISKNTIKNIKRFAKAIEKKSKKVVIVRTNRDIKIDHKFTCIPSMKHFKGKPVKSGFGS